MSSDPSRDPTEPADSQAYTEAHDRLYTRFASLYDLAVRAGPLWRRWLAQALPELRGPDVLEVAFGTGWLMTQYAGRFRTEGIDLNRRMRDIADRNLRRAGVEATLRLGTVESLPYPDAAFDTVVSTMAFTGFPNGALAAAELARVVRPGGRLVLIDISHPKEGNRWGSLLVERVWEPLGDLVRDIPALLSAAGLSVRDQEIGGWGSVHRFVATKPVAR